MCVYVGGWVGGVGGVRSHYYSSVVKLWHEKQNCEDSPLNEIDKDEILCLCLENGMTNLVPLKDIRGHFGSSWVLELP